MAREQVTNYTDDVTGKPMSEAAVKTVYIVVGRECRELDVSGDTYREVFEPLMEAGRKVPNPLAGNTVTPIRRPASGGPRVEAPKPDKEQNQAMRAWWKANEGLGGLPVANVQGRIPSVVAMAFHRHKGKPISAERAEPVASHAAQVAAITLKPRKTVAAPVFAEPQQDEEAKPRRRTAKATTPRKAAAKAAVPAASRARKRT